jgi:hypothetical protein
MTTTQIVGLGWKRGVEDRYPSNNDASLSYGAYNKATDGQIISGMVAGIRTNTGNEAIQAGHASAKAGFHGVFFTEVSDDLDESEGGAPPTVIVGPALLFIRKRALVTGQAYTAGQYVTYGTGGNAGRLIPGGTAAGVDAVGHVQEVQADGILVRLFPPTV